MRCNAVVQIRTETASVFVGPLEPGRYEFFDDFNRAARGFIVVK